MSRRSLMQASLACLVAMALVVPTPTRAESTNPFTGLPIDDAAAQRRGLLVKIANTSNVRPQSGLGLADVVVEHLSEGSITRFTALFLTHAPEKVGSVRSCRLIDLELPQVFDAGLVCSGTSPGVQRLMRQSAAYLDDRTMIADLGRFSGCKDCPMYRTRDAGVPHNLFASTVNAWKMLDERGKNQPSNFHAWRFDTSAPSGGTAVKSVNVPYASGAVTWTYDPASGLWKRSYGRVPHTERTTRQQLAAANVIVVYAHHAVTDIREDVGGARSIQVQLWGQGTTRVFRDGKMIDGIWRRPAQPGVLEFIDFSGNAIPLKPGSTWIELVPLDFPVKAQQ